MIAVSNRMTVILMLLFCSLDSLGYAFWREGEPTDSGFNYVFVMFWFLFF